MADWRLRTMIAAVGFALTAFALYLSFTGAGPPVPTGDILVLMFGFVLATLAVNSMQTRRRSEIQWVSLGDPEERGSFPKPGAEANLEMGLPLTGPPPRNRSGRNTLEPRIREMAIDVLVRTENCSPTEAEEMLAAGAWTDDPFAAGYFTGKLPEKDWKERLRERVGRGTWETAKPAKHAIDELAKLDESLSGNPVSEESEDEEAEDESDAAAAADDAAAAEGGEASA